MVFVSFFEITFNDQLHKATIALTAVTLINSAVDCDFCYALCNSIPYVYIILLIKQLVIMNYMYSLYIIYILRSHLE